MRIGVSVQPIKPQGHCKVVTFGKAFSTLLSRARSLSTRSSLTRLDSLVRVKCVVSSKLGWMVSPPPTW